MPDFTTKRFNSKILNTVYLMLNNFAVKRADYLLSASKTICELQAIKNPKITSVHFPNYPSFPRPLKPKKIGRELKICMVFSRVSDIDLEFLFTASKLLKDYTSMFEVHLIGVGRFDDEVKKNNLYEEVQSYLKFHNPTHKANHAIISCDVGLELNNGLLSFNEHRDPIKVVRIYPFWFDHLYQTRSRHCGRDHSIRTGRNCQNTNRPVRALVRIKRAGFTNAMLASVFEYTKF